MKKTIILIDYTVKKISLRSKLVVTYNTLSAIYYIMIFFIKRTIKIFVFSININYIFIKICCVIYLGWTKPIKPIVFTTSYIVYAETSSDTFLVKRRSGGMIFRHHVLHVLFFFVHTSLYMFSYNISHLIYLLCFKYTDCEFYYIKNKNK